MKANESTQGIGLKVEHAPLTRGPTTQQRRGWTYKGSLEIASQTLEPMRESQQNSRHDLW